MKKVMISLLLGILLIGMTGIVLAEQDNTQTRQEILDAVQAGRQEVVDAVRANAQEVKELREEAMENIRETLQNGEELATAQKGLILRKINSEIMELRTEKARIKTRLNINNEGNASELKAKLSNGRNAEIKIMPETASERALERLRLKVCNETRNCTIELKEVGEGNKTRAVYEARTRKTFKIFGFIKNHEDVRTQIDAETGEEVLTKRPWWAWMASESEESDEIAE